ncbi:hypothetical protein [Altererythrobacter sp. TH136]|uniref:hypothetical protein n=1 Tax=Altererythrobacter sp. TH136 TaxID=2067415 RepID=UPI001164C938|nr:hypothetical protein [Altererythrobacter sp. TH136]QDM41460.1 hypothetical protein C0V74_10720 [Altererythrobacter sp. TH136]
MLEKLESGYLSLLRMVILVVASLSLIVALGALALAILSLVRSTGVTSAEASGGNLAEFIEQQKPLASTGASSNTSTMEIAALPDVRTAAANFKAYLGNRSKIKEDEFVEALQHGADEFGADGALYAEGVKLLSEELKISAGQPLSETRVLQLIDWHHRNFQSDLDRRGSEVAEATSQYWKSAALAGSAFLGFVLTIFVFLFVKIERNLRLVRMVSVQQTENER